MAGWRRINDRVVNPWDGNAYRIATIKFPTHAGNAYVTSIADWKFKDVWLGFERDEDAARRLHNQAMRLASQSDPGGWRQPPEAVRATRQAAIKGECPSPPQTWTSASTGFLAAPSSDRTSWWKTHRDQVSARALAIAAVLVVAAVGGGIAAVTSLVTAPQWKAGQPCTVQMDGHSMAATASGAKSQAVCRGWVKAGNNASNPTGDPRVCTFSRAGLSISVTDSGGQAYGEAMCIDLHWWSRYGGPVPSLPLGGFPFSQHAIDEGPPVQTPSP